MSDKPPKNIKRFTFRTTNAMWSQLDQLLIQQDHRNMNALIQDCLRSYIDDSEDTIGSRKHFNNRLAERMDRLEAMVLWNCLMIQSLLANISYTILDELNPDATTTPPSPDVQVQKAMERSKRVLPTFLKEQEAIVNELENYRRSQAKSNKPKGA